MLTKFIVSFIIILIYHLIKTKRSFQMLQQNWYNDGNRYLKWIWKNKDKVFINWDIIALPIIFTLYLIDADNIWTIVCVIALYTILSLRLINKNKKTVTKLKLNVTARVKRLYVTNIIIYTIPIIIFTIIFNENDICLYYLIYSIIIYLNYFMTYLTNLINKPIEKLNAYKFKRRAMKKLENMPSLEVVGITGSYGKTSSKNILNDILSIKYNSLPTPKNFNTPVGLIITINNHLDKFHDILIAEMGAFKRGEIKELCDLVKPKYGILTKIGVAHLESFGSQENIQKGKFELIESLPSDGVGILNGDDKLQLSYKLKNNVKTIWIGIENKNVDVYADNIKLNIEGTTFECHFKGDKNKYLFETKLLGKANIYNILAGIALGKHLGLSIEQLQMGVRKVRPVEHRLELKKMGIISIIDDAYNANPDGTKMALDVLAKMPGKKIAISSGMIELGDKSYELNKELGNYMSKKTDIAILLGKEQTKPIYEGLLENKFKKENIYIFDNVNEAFKKVNEIGNQDTCVLVQSDLPDIFDEK